MIPFLLYKKFSIDSDKSPEEVRRIMEAETGPLDRVVPFGLGLYGGTVFMGEVGKTAFKVIPRPTPEVRNPAIPLILGQIRAQGNGTKVEGFMRLPWGVYAFCVFWFGWIAMLYLFCVLAVIAGDSGAWEGIAATLGMFLLGQLIVRIGFHIPAGRAKRKLERLFGKAEP